MCYGAAEGMTSYKMTAILDFSKKLEFLEKVWECASCKRQFYYFFVISHAIPQKR